MPFLQNNSPNIDFLRMKRGKDLTEAEKKIIDTLSKNKFTHNQIAKEINRPRSTIICFLKYKANRGERNHCGRKTQVPERLKRNILKLATQDKMSTRNISNSVSSNLSHMTVYRHLKAEKHIQYGKIVAEDRLTKTHLMKRLKWAEKYQTFDKEWQNIIFSDEKKWNIDGPDGYKYFWYDKRAKNILSKIPNCRQSVHVWGAFCGTKKLNLHVIEGNLNAEKYQNLLQKTLIPFKNAENGRNLIFQADNAPSHTAISTKNWLQNKIDCMDWPSVSPDLNPIENMWGILSQRVYQGGKVYENVRQLRLAILKEWENIEVSVLNSLTNSMKKRVFEVIRGNGRRIKY